jgi:hypothetical protein
MDSCLAHNSRSKNFLLKHVPGVHAGTVNNATNAAVVKYDETITDVGALRVKIIGPLATT